MKKLKALFIAIIFVLFANRTIAQYSTDIGYIPSITADRRVDWHNVGDSEKPTSYNRVFNVLNYNAVPNDGLDDRQSIQDAIEAARNYIATNPGSYAAVYLTAGNKHYFKNRGIPLLICL